MITQQLDLNNYHKYAAMILSVYNVMEILVENPFYRTLPLIFKSFTISFIKFIH